MRATSRTFAFEAGLYSGAKRAISCDGLVAGAALDLSHWAENRTPARFKADTSTEIALNFARTSEATDQWADAVVVNNHFDTDGALSAWVLLEPEAAEAHRDLLVAAAEAGDFDEWPGLDRGLWLDAALRSLAAGAANDPESYSLVLPRIPELLASLDARRDLWGREWDALQAAAAAQQSGRIVTEMHGYTGVASHAMGQPEAPGALLARNFLPGARRYLLAFAADDSRFHYRYERPRYAWADTIVRPRVAEPPTAPLLAALGTEWTDTDLPGMTGIIQTRTPVKMAPHEVLGLLLRVDRG